MYKLMVSDLDGTLLIDHGQICPEARKTIIEAEKGTFKFTIATGRIYGSARQFARALNIKIPIISCNGAYIKSIDEEAPLYEKAIPSDILKMLFDMTYEEEELMLQFYTDDTLYSERLAFSTPFYIESNEAVESNWRVKVVVTGKAKDYYKDKDFKIYKVQLNSNHPETLDKYKSLLEKYPDIQTTTSWSSNLEITHTEASKGKAIEILAKEMNLDLSEVIAIGDNQNDLSMLKKAGKGVAMGNASDFVKSQVTYVTYDNTECGVANALKDLVLNK